jgi:hypothetical protein
MNLRAKQLANVLMTTGAPATPTELAMARDLLWWRAEAVAEGQVIDALLSHLPLPHPERKKLLASLRNQFKVNEP